MARSKTLKSARSSGPRRRHAKSMSYDRAVKVLIKHHIISKKSDLYAQNGSRGGSGLLLGAI